MERYTYARSFCVCRRSSQSCLSIARTCRKEASETIVTRTAPSDDNGMQFAHHILHEEQYPLTPQNISKEDSASLTPEKPATTPGVEATFQSRPRHLKDNYISPVKSPKSLQTSKGLCHTRDTISTRLRLQNSSTRKGSSPYG
jgi:hypothetical protein